MGPKLIIYPISTQKIKWKIGIRFEDEELEYANCDLEKRGLVYKIMRLDFNVEESELNTLLDKYNYGFYADKTITEKVLEELECLIIAKRLAM